MSFEQLRHVSRICHSFGNHFLFVEEWAFKKNSLMVYLSDLPHLMNELKKSNFVIETTKDCPVVEYDPVPKIRLISACEAATNCLYSMAEIAAQFGNRVSGGLLPSSFNKLRKKVENGKCPDSFLKDWVNDFQWYKKVRELRTEWVHYSTLFIGFDREANEPILVVRSFRRKVDKEEFQDRIQIKFEDLISWISNAMKTLDGYSNHLLVNYVIPKLDLDEKLTIPKRDEKGFPVMKPDGTFEIHKTTVRGYIEMCGIRMGQ